MIIPGEGLLNVPENKTGLLAEVVNENSAIVENEVKSESNTGNNKIDGEGLIETGDAYSNSNVTTIANTNITKNNWFLLMINEMGSWRGRITGWNVENPNQNTYSYDFDIGDSDWQNNYFFNAIYKIYNKNSASVHNSVSSFANSGNNSIENGANGNIATGNASAVSNVFNLVNTNIAGNNWMFGIVNLMGEWEGDAVFAYPELKISISDGKESASPKEETSYTIEYENIGKAGCEEVKIYAGLPEYFSYQSDDFGGGYSSQGRAMVWNLEGLNPGEKKSFSIRGKLAENFPEGETILVANAGITTSTKEIEIENNSSSDETKVFGYFQSNENNYFEYGDIDPEIKITREISPGSVVRRGNFVLHSIIVENEGDTPVYNLTVEDNLSNEAGDLGAYQWPIGEIGKGEKFLIQYQVEIAPFAPLGIYTNRALAFGNDAYGREYESKKATSEIRVIQGLAFKNQVENWENPIPTAQAEEDPIVLGESESCQEWPFWVWLSILGLFLAAISTLMASSGLNLFAKWGGTIVSCGAVFAIWYYFEKCRLYPWYPYAVVAAFILSFFAYLTWLRRKINNDKNQL